MKKLICYGLSLLLIGNLTYCKKDNPHPDVSNFSVSQITPFVKGKRGATIQLTSTTLAPGAYAIKYRTDNGVEQPAAFIMKNTTGTFQTPVTDSGYGPMISSLSISEIVNEKGYKSTLTANNTTNIFDSSGLMIASISGPVNDSFRAVSIGAFVSNTEGWLSIDAHYYEATGNRSKSIWLYADRFYGNISNYSFSAKNQGNQAKYQSLTNPFNIVENYGSSGSFIINSVAPLITGTFTFTCDDSTKVTGSFSCKPIVN